MGDTATTPAPASTALVLSDDLRARIGAGLHEARGTMAGETLRALRKGVTAFASWCAPRDLCPLPADPRAVAAYVDALHDGGRKPAGIRQAVWAIGRLHALARLENPAEDQVVALAVKRAACSSGSRQRQAAPLGELAVARIQATTGLRLADLRDLALLLVARDLLARRSEAVALQVEDFEFAADGTATALIRRSKTHQAGEDAVLFLGHSTVKALRDWLDGAGIVSGPVFRPVNKGGRVGTDALDPSKVPFILKRMAGRAGLDPARISGHSCRVGMAQDLMASGTDTAATQQAGRWKTPVMPARYTERIEASRGAVALYHRRREDRPLRIRFLGPLSKSIRLHAMLHARSRRWRQTVPIDPLTTASQRLQPMRRGIFCWHQRADHRRCRNVLTISAHTMPAAKIAGREAV